MSDAPPKSGPLLPPDADRDRPLFAVASILVFLACLAALGAAGAWGAAASWTAQLTDEITVQLMPADGRDADADAAEAANRIAQLPGVIDVEARSRESAEALLRPWLGAGALPDDLPVPRLIAVTVDPVEPPAPGAIEALLEDAPYQVIVDDHGRWADAVARAAGAVRYFAFGLVFVLGVAAAAVVAFAARASLAARWEIADALHLVGAPDPFITGLFQRRFFILGLKAGLAGAILATLAALGLAVAGGPAGSLFFLPTLELHWSAAAIPPAAAVLSGLISALAARAAVRSALRARWT